MTLYELIQQLVQFNPNLEVVAEHAYGSKQNTVYSAREHEGKVILNISHDRMTF